MRFFLEKETGNIFRKYFIAKVLYEFISKDRLYLTCTPNQIILSVEISFSKPYESTVNESSNGRFTVFKPWKKDVTQFKYCLWD